MERFIVGTGRCGSTLLSRMLGHNRRLLSMNEFWSVPDREGVFQQGQFAGPEAADILCRSNLLNDLVISRTAHLDAGATGHSIRKEARAFALKAHRLPAIQIFLAGLSDDHEGLIAATLAQVRGQPRQSLAAHWRRMFDFLAAYLRRDAWVERSGVSIEIAGRIAQWYPGARIVHLHRDGPTNALGIRAFRHFVLYASFFFDPPSDDELEAIFTCEPGSADDPVMRRLGGDIPSLERFGRYWSWQVVTGHSALLRLPRERWIDVAYEDMIADTPGTLGRIAEFLDLPDDEGWIARASGEVDPEVIPDRVSELAEDELRKLREACRPGMAILGRDTVNPYEEAMKSARRVFGSIPSGALNQMREPAE
ncbi:MAG: sulfotransferase [Novosphingobium sp.]|nr:sulfotransferase [Novosphingobium sp.]